MSFYGSYRGRRRLRTWLKVLLIVLAVVVLVGIIVFFKLQDHIVFSEDGIHLDLPSLQSTDDAGETSIPSEEIIIQTTEPSAEPSAEAVQLEQVRAIFVPASALSDSTELQGYVQQLSELGGNALILDMKADNGRLSYYSGIRSAIAAGTSSDSDTVSDVISELKNDGIYLIARISCFKDNLYPAYDTGASLVKSNGSLWADGDVSAWLNPYSEDAREYATAIAAEVAQLGFDEILFDNLSYPTSGSTTRIEYGDEVDTTFTESITEFADQLVSSLSETDIAVSAVADETACSEGVNETSGQDLAALALLFDRIYSPVSASETDIVAAANALLNVSGYTLDPSVSFVPKLESPFEESSYGWAVGW